MATNARRERSRASLLGRRSGREGARRPAGEPVRDRRGLGDHGRARALERPRRPSRTARADRRRLHVDGTPGDRGRPPGRRCDGGHHEGGDQAEPRPDARGAAHADPRGTLREHRTRQQLDHRRSDRPEAGRLRRDRGGLRLRPGVPEVLRHRVSVRRLRSVRRCPGHDRARDEVPRRHAVRPARHRGPRRAPPRDRQPRGAHRHRRGVRAPVRGLDQQLPHRHREGDRDDPGAGGWRRRRDGGA